MRRFGIVGLLVGLLLLGGVGIVAYQLGVSAGAASAAVAGGATVVYTTWGAGFGFPLLGLLFGLLFLGLLFGVMRRLAFGGRTAGPGFGPGRGHGPWGHGPWGHGGPGSWSEASERPVPPPFAAMLDRWHDDAHGTARAPGAGPTGAEAAPPSTPTATQA